MIALNIKKNEHTAQSTASRVESHTLTLVGPGSHLENYLCTRVNEQITEGPRIQSVTFYLSLEIKSP